MLVGKKPGREEGLENWRPGEVTEGKAARLEVAGRKQVRKKICFCLYGYAALCATKMQTARRGRLGDA